MMMKPIDLVVRLLLFWTCISKADAFKVSIVRPPAATTRRTLSVYPDESDRPTVPFPTTTSLFFHDRHQQQQEKHDTATNTQLKSTTQQSSTWRISGIIHRLKSVYHYFVSGKKVKENKSEDASDLTSRTTQPTASQIMENPALIQASTMMVDSEPTTTTATSTNTRWSISAPEVNLSGQWKPIITSAFKLEYDEYLKGCGTNAVYRNFCRNVLGFVTERIAHNGTSLTIAGTTPVGTWTRTLISSGNDPSDIPTMTDCFEPLNVTIVDPDGETVQIESTWVDHGHTHMSWLRDKPRAMGGVIESRRYLDQQAQHLICESLFTPSQAEEADPNSRFHRAKVTWTFKKVA